LGKTYDEINARIESGDAVILTKEEYIKFIEKNGVSRVTREVDVVTTGTFGPMCSSGAFLNFGHSKPRIKLGGGTILLNDVPAYASLAATDTYIGATAVRIDDNSHVKQPSSFRYGGGHVIHDLIAGREVKLTARAYGTDCYPRRELETWVRLEDINDAILCNPRNAYQNYNCAVNLSNRTLYTYMGVLKPHLGNATYCSAAQLSPLLNDPLFRTIGIGTRIFLGGGIGYVFSQGTQHNPEVRRSENGTPRMPAGTLAVCGDLKQMSADWLVGASFLGYGPTLKVGIGAAIPILDGEMAQFASVKDEDIITQIVDYSDSYPQCNPGSLGEVDYGTLKSGRIEVEGNDVPTSALSSYKKAVEISRILKSWILSGKFRLERPLAQLPGPGSGHIFKSLKEVRK